MRSILSAIVIAAGLAGLAGGAQATPLQSAMPLGATATENGLVQAQMMAPGERRMMRRDRMERRMMHRGRMERRMMRHDRRRMMHRRMMRNM